MKALFKILIFVLPFVIGLGYIKFNWIILSVVIAYLSSIFYVGELFGDFANPKGTTQMGAQKKVTMVAIVSFAVIAMIYGFGKLIAWLLLDNVYPIF